MAWLDQILMRYWFHLENPSPFPMLLPHGLDPLSHRYVVFQDLALLPDML